MEISSNYLKSWNIYFSALYHPQSQIPPVFVPLVLKRVFVVLNRALWRPRYNRASCRVQFRFIVIVYWLVAATVSLFYSWIYLVRFAGLQQERSRFHGLSLRVLGFDILLILFQRLGDLRQFRQIQSLDLERRVSLLVVANRLLFPMSLIVL